MKNLFNHKTVVAIEATVSCVSGLLVGLVVCVAIIMATENLQHYSVAALATVAAVSIIAFVAGMYMSNLKSNIAKWCIYLGSIASGFALPCNASETLEQVLAFQNFLM